MPNLAIAIPGGLDAALEQRSRALGARTKEEYLLALIESDCAASELEAVVARRLDGPFTALEEDWKERVRERAADGGES